MKIRVFIKIGRNQGVLGWDGEQLTICVDAPPIKGAANTKLIEILSKWLSVSKSMVHITKGHTARYKTLELNITSEEFNNLVNRLPRLPKQSTLFG